MVDRLLISKKAGFTLLETLFVLAAIGVMVALVFSPLRGWFERERGEEIMRQLFNVINYARSEAIKQGKQVIICPTVDRKTCLNSPDWSRGYMVIVADNITATPPLKSVLRVYGETHGKLIWKAGVGGTYLSFIPNGFTHYKNGTFIYCTASQSEESLARTLIVMQTGRARFPSYDDPIYKCSEIR